MINRDKFYFRTFCILFWIAATYGFVSQELLPFLESAWRPVVLVIDAAMMLLGLKLMRGKNQIWLVSTFFLLAFVSNRVNGLSIVETFNGCREFFPLIWPYIIVDYLFRSKQAPQFRRSIEKQMKIFLIMQAVCITEQFIRYGANDHGGGTMGNGYSGQISMMIISIVFYFVSKDWDGDEYMKSFWRNRWYFLMLYPVFLNETKVSFVIITLMFLLLYKFELKSVWKITITLPVFVVAIVGLYSVYIWTTGQDDDVGSSDYIEGYLSGTDDYTTDELIDIINAQYDEIDMTNEETIADLPRFVLVGLAPGVVEQSDGGLVLGAGVGHFKGGETLKRTKFSEENKFLFSGSVTQFLLTFVSLGILGMIWSFFWFKNAIKWRRREGALALQWKIYLTALVVLIFFYNDCFRYFPFPVLYYMLACFKTYPAVKPTEKPTRHVA